ncbi:hypothetical protein HYALB_00005230 [Hymenoscyphus albidus]|uniref:Uncharacterized protein n=1 Tax=Hymenoscyphus albidus TaxID=595503 RepID=A0A9N9LQV0_9HELO|nr:hypothetical protein HYALB_00005230 [Hymenoscyphus albidus]
MSSFKVLIPDAKYRIFPTLAITSDLTGSPPNYAFRTAALEEFAAALWTVVDALALSTTVWAMV